MIEVEVELVKDGQAASGPSSSATAMARFSSTTADLTALGTPALLVATFVSGSLAGLTERIVIAVLLAWLTILAAQVRRGGLAQQ